KIIEDEGGYCGLRGGYPLEAMMSRQGRGLPPVVVTGEMSSDSLASFITLSPPYPVPTSDASLSAEFEIPPGAGNGLSNANGNGNGLLHLGRACFRATPVGDVKIRIEDLSMHLVPLGETGYGKTRFVVDLLRQLWDLDPTVNWLILDLKGEYYDQLQRHIDERIEVLKAGGDINCLRQGSGVGSLPLRIDLLNYGPHSKSDECDEGAKSERTGRLFSALKESLAGLFKENTELSPMMERILFESLKQVMTTAGNLGDSTKGDTSGGGFFDALFHEVESYVTAHKGRDIVMSGEALKNRLERFRRGAIGDILNHNYRNDKVKGCSPSPDFKKMIRTKKLIIDLSGCVRKGCSKEDIRLLLNLITSVIFEEALKRGLVGAPALRHLTVIEEANLLAPDILRRKTMGDLTSTEDMILTARGFGEGLILVAQRPTISSFILANAGTKVVFRSPYDAARVAEFMGLNEEQENAVKFLRKFEALVTTVQGGPYRISTAKPQQPSAPTSHPRGQQQKPDSSSLLAHVASKPSVIEATEDENSSAEDDDGGDTNYGGQGRVVACDGDVKRLLKRSGVSSDRFKLFGTIASSSSHVKVSDAVLGVFGGEEQRYLDALGNLTDTAVWRKPLVAVDGWTIRLTEYGREVWNTIQQTEKKRRRGISG
nr:DUF87 domain-containing protein [Candidatus Njordarchaeota archaeon]